MEMQKRREETIMIDKKVIEENGGKEKRGDENDRQEDDVLLRDEDARDQCHKYLLYVFCNTVLPTLGTHPERKIVEYLSRTTDSAQENQALLAATV